MKTRLFITMAALAILATGCTDNENDATDLWNGEIRLSSGISAQTRTDNAPDTQIAGGQMVGVFINDATAPTVIGANLKYDANGSGSLTLNTGTTQTTPYYPTTGNGVKIIAYHPYAADASLEGDGYDFTVNADQNGNSSKDYYDSDLLYSSKAEAYSRQSEAQELTFKHLLSKVVCTLTEGTGLTSNDLTGATVSIVQAQLKGTFKPEDGSFTLITEDDASDVKMNSTLTPNSYIAVIPPQTFSQGGKLLEVALANGGKLYYKVPADADVTFETGKVYRYAITVSLTGLTVTSSIDNWTEGASTSGSAEME